MVKYVHLFPNCFIDFYGLSKTTCELVLLYLYSRFRVIERSEWYIHKVPIEAIDRGGESKLLEIGQFF